MKTVKINFVGFHKGFNKEDNDFTNILRERYKVVISKNPDYLFYSSFGKDYIKYDCIRIFFTGECITPDFNHCDYAMGFDRIQLGDRYLRVPLYRVFQYKKYYDSLFLENRIQSRITKDEFCDFVYSNCFADDIRAQLFTLLSKYKKVNSGGRYLNNVGGPVSNKFEFQCKHKFSITVENGCYPGYSTEKIVEAFAAGTIPIYIGDPDITCDFNEKAFINGNQYDNLNDIVDRVIEIDNNDTLYNEMLHEIPVKVDNRNNNDIKEFLFNIFDQDLEKARRRPRTRFAIEEEKHYRRYGFLDKWFFQKIQRMKRIYVRFKNNAL